MSTDYPYSQQWRERTRARLRACGVSLVEVIERTGLDLVDASLPLVDPRRPVSLEFAGPIDELLDRLEEQREAEVIEHGPQPRPRLTRAMHVPGRGDLVPVAVDLDALTNLGTSREAGRAGTIHLRRERR